MECDMLEESVLDTARLPRGISTLIACGLALSACGGSSSSKTTSGSATSTPSAGATLNHEQMIAAGDGICTRYRASVNALPKPTSSSSNADAAAYVHGVLNAAQRAIASFAQLKPSATDASVIQKYNASQATQFAKLRRASQALDVGDVRGFQGDLRAAAQGAGHARGLAQGFGFKVCGSP